MSYWYGTWIFFTIYRREFPQKLQWYLKNLNTCENNAQPKCNTTRPRVNDVSHHLVQNNRNIYKGSTKPYICVLMKQESCYEWSSRNHVMTLIKKESCHSARHSSCQTEFQKERLSQRALYHQLLTFCHQAVLITAGIDGFTQKMKQFCASHYHNCKVVKFNKMVLIRSLWKFYDIIVQLDLLSSKHESIQVIHPLL